MDTEKLTYSIPVAAKKIGVSEPTLWKAIKKGQVPVLRVSNRVLIPISALSKMLESAGSKGG